MKYFPVSDLHLEFFPLEEISRLGKLIKTIETDNLCLCGDICSWGVDHLDKLFMFLDEILPHFPKVYYIPGNHEYYGCRWKSDYVEEVCSQLTSYASNLEFAEEPGLRFNGSDKILLSTLWYPSIPETFLYTSHLNDFSMIRGFDPNKANEIYEKTRSLMSHNPNIWILHHLPAKQSIDERYKSDPLNCYFLGNLEEEMNRIQPDLVLHGHTHFSFDYLYNQTRVLCNPYGYFNYQTNSEFQLS